MKYFVSISLFFFALDVMAQVDTLNRTDSEGKKQGYWKNYSEADGNVLLHSEGKYLDDMKTGSWIHYYNNGTVRGRMEYQRDRINGRAVTYYLNGNVADSGNWMNQKWVGKHFSYYETAGQLKALSCYDDAGRQDGAQYEYYNNGNLKSESGYVKDTLVWQKCYGENGSLMEIIYPDSLTIKFDRYGIKKSAIRKNKKGFTEIEYNVNGNISSEASYIDKKREGMLLLYYEDGTLKFKGEYKDDRMFGERIYYTGGGKLMDGDFTWYKNENLKEREGRCKKGRPEGELKVYDMYGNLNMKGSFKKGKPDGIFYYYINGKVYSIEKYVDGCFVHQLSPGK